MERVELNEMRSGRVWSSALLLWRDLRILELCEIEHWTCHWRIGVLTELKFVKSSLVSAIEEIYVPINKDNSHRYLLVIDFARCDLLLMDSYPSKDMSDVRRRAIQKVFNVIVSLEGRRPDHEFCHKGILIVPLLYHHFISRFPPARLPAQSRLVPFPGMECTPGKRAGMELVIIVYYFRNVAAVFG
ncbi:hypothetical protein VNO77_18433 [Canavalia gladiata]|uniref:Ubiquitin-like protease family profile domain-containing protein n=1 Tax=Canavalia gladiata TaxID=3824 RepID=A0AAN9LKX3_CANGL